MTNKDLNLVVVTSQLAVTVVDHGGGAVYGALSYSLLRGVQELVLAAPAVTDPEARIRPEAADCVHVASLQLVDVHCVDVLQPLGVDLEDGERDGLKVKEHLRPHNPSDRDDDEAMLVFSSSDRQHTHLRWHQCQQPDMPTRNNLPLEKVHRAYRGMFSLCGPLETLRNRNALWATTRQESGRQPRQRRKSDTALPITRWARHRCRFSTVTGGRKKKREEEETLSSACRLLWETADDQLLIWQRDSVLEMGVARPAKCLLLSPTRLREEDFRSSELRKLTIR
ncbi:hypothetical protein EYF80_030142 [Liparis tanakae]|uniref:Uncharacterized protein n=1 Tax=Liparis tanakae TaxID=230148 RepID=A0A4Z2H1L0_9TELE|nr:hypothetical protein EYF80_030142 [Liparis tanakae]